MKVLGIDYGERYIGVAIGDTDTGIAFPKTVIKLNGKERAVEELGRIVALEGIKRLVIGLPLSFKMQDTPSTKKVRKFVMFLRMRLGIPIDLENEVLSSSHAKRLSPNVKKIMTHAQAAALVLQDWLDKNSNKI